MASTKPFSSVELSIKEWIAYFKLNRNTWCYGGIKPDVKKLKELACFLKSLHCWMNSAKCINEIVKTSPSIGGLLMLVYLLFKHENYP